MPILAGSERDPVKNAKVVGDVHPDERFEVTFVLKPNEEAALHEHVQNIAKGEAEHLDHDSYSTYHSTDEEIVNEVIDFAQEHGMIVVHSDADMHTVTASLLASQACEAFGVELKQYEHDGGSYRGRTGPINLPEEIVNHVQAVLGLDNRMIATPHSRGRLPRGNIRWRGFESYNYFPTTLAKIYDFPANGGEKQTIAIIELGGGYRTADLQNYFQARLNMTPPVVKTVSVSGGLNQPTGDPNGPDGEVMLDIEVAGAIAPKATIITYFAPNTDAGFLNAVKAAIHDTVNKPDIISISWGGPEDSWTPQSLSAFNTAFAAAAALGITVTAAAGDNGSSDGDDDGGDHVDFPASCPYVLACGGTNLHASHNCISSETVWNDGEQGGATGGGVSVMFDKPAYQSGLSVKMRGVPDVAAVADPETGYDVRVDGQNTVYGGTSAVAPLYAALFARINSMIGKRVGQPHAKLYANPAAFNDITQGNNGSFMAEKGWDATTGLGSPNGQKILNLFK